MQLNCRPQTHRLLPQAQTLQTRADVRTGAAASGWNFRWMVAVLTELAEPGRMFLLPVIGRHGQILDFECRSANASASLVLKCRGNDLSGCSLKALLRDCPQPEAVFQTYERAFLGRRPQAYEWAQGAWRWRHQVAPSPAGLSAVLTDLASVERLSKARQAAAAAEHAHRQGLG